MLRPFAVSCQPEARFTPDACTRVETNGVGGRPQNNAAVCRKHECNARLRRARVESSPGSMRVTGPWPPAPAPCPLHPCVIVSVSFDGTHDVTQTVRTSQQGEKQNHVTHAGCVPGRRSLQSSVRKRARDPQQCVTLSETPLTEMTRRVCYWRHSRIRALMNSWPFWVDRHLHLKVPSQTQNVRAASKMAL